MAKEQPDNDPLAGMTKPFLALLGFVWLLTLGLLMFHLSAQAWAGLDGNALVLLGILFGVALLPFVSHFSIAGLLEFRRKLGRVESDVESMSTQITSLVNAVAVSRSEANVTIRNEISQRLDAREQEVIETRAYAVQGATDLAVNQPTVVNMWSSAWLSVEYLASLLYLRTAAKEGEEAVFDHLYAPSSEIFMIATTELLQGDALDGGEKDLLTKLLSINEKIEDQGDAADDADSFLQATRAAKMFAEALHNKLVVHVTVESAGLEKVRQGGPAELDAVNASLYRAARSRKALKGKEEEGEGERRAPKVLRDELGKRWGTEAQG